VSRSPFDALAAAYEAARPTYPDGLYDALPLPGATVADVGAGTGIATRGMLARGARVVAFDLAPNMLARVGAHASLLGTVVADGHRLPMRDGSVDLVTYAQAFHWMDPSSSVPEARRVVRSGGALAVWWNDSDSREEPWRMRQEELQNAGGSGRDYRIHDVGDDLLLGFESVETAEVPWVRDLDLEAYLTFLSSKSYVARLGEGQGAFLDEQRALLRDSFPDGVVSERFVTRLWIAR
jgi:SAM-dependent methyltransferase